MSRKEERAGLTEDIVQIQTERLGASERKRCRSLCLGSGVFIEGGGLVHVSPRHPGTGQTGMGAQVSSISHLCPGPRGLAVKVSGVSGLKKQS